MLPMICLSERHPQVQQSNSVTMETVLHPQSTELVCTAVLDRAISPYLFLEGFAVANRTLRYCRAKINPWKLRRQL